jgi:hypothetical protein
LFFCLAAAVSLAGLARADCPAGDLNGDCRVDGLDVLVFAQQWLQPSQTCSDSHCADLDGVDGVNMFDFALLTRSWHEVGVPLVINELMASNSNTIRDPQGQYDDWIEIHNIGPYPIDMGNMYLTDDLTRPAKWRIPGNRPAATTIPAGGYLLVWADEDVAASGLHANFKLSADGEEIGLFDGDGTTLIDSVVFPEQTSGIAYGRDPNVGNSWRFLAVPTPGARNDGGYPGEVKAPEFSHERGFYDTPFLLTLATETKDAIIYYSTDGAAPYEFTGRSPTGTVYSNPILINKTTCLRVKAIKPGWKPSAITTRTFLLNADAAVKSLPVISLVGDARRTFYEPDGIMAIVGGHYNTDGTWAADDPKNYNNPIRRGMAYERPVSFEWVRPEDGSGFQVDCGIRVHGSDYMRPRYRRSAGLWTGSAKFSFRLYFRGEYGPSWLEYPLFPFEVERFKSIALRGGHNDQVNPFIKDELIRRLHKDMGNVASSGTMANLFINGEYKGYFNPCEHIKDAFCQQWYHSDKDWDVMTMSGVRDGDALAWNEMIDYARNHNLSDDAYYQEMARRLDIPAFADYLVLQLWCGNWDWPQNNWAAARERSDEGRWRFFIWDAEGAIYSDRLSTVYFDRLNTQTNAIGYLYRALKVSSTFRQVFCDRIYRHFYNDGALTEANIRKRFLELRDQMRGVIPNMDMYVLSTWVPNRLGIFLDACKREGMFTTAGPIFNINGAPRNGGYVSAGDTLTMSDHGRSYAIHYTTDGSDPQWTNLKPASPTATTLVAENTAKRVIVPTRDPGDTWKNGAGFYDGGWLYSSGSPGGVGYNRGSGYEGLISLDVETVMYGRNATCYIRIPFTFGGSPADFKSLTLNIRYDDGFIVYLNGAEIARRNFDGTPAWNSSAVASRPDSEAAQFESIDVSAFLGTLQQGDNLLAIHGLNLSATDADFLISAELIADTSDSRDNPPLPATQYSGPITLTASTNVKARTLSGSTWSALSETVFAVGPVAENLRITEVMFHPQAAADANDPNEEFIELTNIGTETINLNLVRFTEGIDFTFPSIELAPAEHTVVVQDRSTFESRYGRRPNVAGQYSGRLDNAGERIRLEDAAGQTILDFSYKDDWRSITDGKGFSLTFIDPVNPNMGSWDQKNAWRASAYAGGSPGRDDDGIVPNPGAVVINEVLAHSHADDSDWIELYNTTGTPINVGGWFLSDSQGNLLKYQIRDGTTMGPFAYLVFRQDRHFGNANAVGCYEPFALSENGESLYLSSAQNGVLTGYREVEDFGASATGTSFGRYYKASTNSYDFVAMAQNTPGFANTESKTGPIVIYEIMYHPDWPVGGSYTNEQYEYIELLNISGAPVTLYDYNAGEPWKFTDGIEFSFPDNPPATIPAGGCLLVVQDPAAFLWRYPSVPPEQIFGPYDGKLNNAGESLELSTPGDVDEDGIRHYICVDRIDYSDGSGPADLWPAEADGRGRSLARRVAAGYGNDPANWQSAAPTPGAKR